MPKRKKKKRQSRNKLCVHKVENNEE